jgi:hypothetical protein
LATLQSLAKRGGAGIKAFKAQSTSDKGES